MSLIPSHVKEFLWDINLETLSTEKHYKFIIERVLEFGDEEAMKWMIKTYTKEQIIEVLTSSKRISPKTGGFYALYFGIPREELLCIKKPFTQKQNRF
jgi:hypothetical protein